MGFGMNAAKTGKVEEEFGIQMNQFGQAHLARQDTTNSELGLLKKQKQMIMQKMAQMCQQMNMAANKPLTLMQQMQFQPQQFQQQQCWSKPRRAEKTNGHGQAAKSMENSFGGYNNNNTGRRMEISILSPPHLVLLYPCNRVLG